MKAHIILSCLYLWNHVLCFGLGVGLGDTSKSLIMIDKKDDDSKIQSGGSKISLKDNENEIENNEPFIPTAEWQVIKKGQAIPAGLHVRVDMQTGLKEAKLMEGDDGSRYHTKRKKSETDKSSETDHSKVILSEEEKPIQEFEQKDKLYFTKQHLKEALHDFRDKFENKDLKMDEEIDLNRADAVKKKFRTIEQIRAELEDTMAVQIKSDVEVMKNKIEILAQDNSTDEEREVALDDLEYYSHQVDNAKDLETIGGLQIVIHYLNSSNSILQEKAARVVGAAVQSNPKVQTAALKHDILPLLLRLISYSSDKHLQKKALYALSALVRSHSKAQVAFLKLEGLSHLMTLLKNNNAGQLRIKVMTLISDLLVEQDDVKQTMIKSGKFKAEDTVPLMTALVSQGWCDVIPDLLDTTDYDMQEKVLQAIKSSLSGCKEIFPKKKLSKNLNKLKDSIAHRINSETDGDFKNYLIEMQDQVKNAIKQLE